MQKRIDALPIYEFYTFAIVAIESSSVFVGDTCIDEPAEKSSNFKKSCAIIYRHLKYCNDEESKTPKYR